MKSTTHISKIQLYTESKKLRDTLVCRICQKVFSGKSRWKDVEQHSKRHFRNRSVRKVLSDDIQTCNNKSTQKIGNESKKQILRKVCTHDQTNLLRQRPLRLSQRRFNDDAKYTAEVKSNLIQENRVSSKTQIWNKSES